MKSFIYFEGQEGGMGTHEVRTPADLTCLYGWMDTDCYGADAALVEWMSTADVGEAHDHRLGTLVRLKDTR